MRVIWAVSIIASILIIGVILPANATTDCSFTIDPVKKVMKLDADCTTYETILIPDGFTLDGKGRTIMAGDPTGGHFLGAIIQNAGATAHVKNLVLTTNSLANVCDPASPTDARLRGILFNGASGSITHNEVNDINQGASGCQEGNAIEIRNAPFDGSHPNTQTVEISHNKLTDWQKTGIVANGDVNVNIQHNQVGASATQQNLAPNGIQLGFGVLGSVTQNNVDGNQWLGSSNFAGTGILIFFVDDVDVSKNVIQGNSDVEIFAFLVTDSTFDNNKVFDSGEDGPHGDFGIVDVSGTDNSFTNNKVRGFDFPYFDVMGGKNKVIPGPQPVNAFFQ